ARKALRNKELPAALGQAAQSAFAIDPRDVVRDFRERVAPRTRGRLAGSRRPGLFRGCFGGSVEQWVCCRISLTPARLVYHIGGGALDSRFRGHFSRTPGDPFAAGPR